MPFKDEKLFYRVRIHRKLKKPLEEKAKEQSISVIEATSQAVEKWLSANVNNTLTGGPPRCML